MTFQCEPDYVASIRDFWRVCSGINSEAIVKMVGEKTAVIDCFGILDDEQIQRYFEFGCEVKALGRGHIQQIKEKVRSSRESNSPG